MSKQKSLKVTEAAAPVEQAGPAEPIAPVEEPAAAESPVQAESQIDELTAALAEAEELRLRGLEEIRLLESTLEACSREVHHLTERAEVAEGVLAALSPEELEAAPPGYEEFSAKVAACVLRGAFAYCGQDEDGNIATYMADGVVELAVHQPDKSHRRLIVRLPETFMFEVVEEL